MNISVISNSLIKLCLAKTSSIVHWVSACYQSFDKFEMRTMKDYHDFYLKCDVFLLADVFEKFRNRCLENYGLRPQSVT